MTSIVRSSLFAFALTATAFATSVQAAEMQPALAAVEEIKVVPGGQAALEAYIQKAIEANDQIGSKMAWTVTQTAIGDNTTYSLIRLVNSFGELKPIVPNAIVQAYGPGEAQNLLQELAPFVESVHTAVWTHRTDLSRSPPERDTPPTLLQTIILTTAPGTTKDFEEYIAKIGEAARKLNKQDMYWDFYAPAIGAGTDYGVVIPRWSYSDLDTPPPSIPDLLEEAFGRREATRLVGIASDTILQMQTALSAVRPELSRQPAGETAAGESVSER